MRGKKGAKPAARGEFALRQPVQCDRQGLIFHLGA